MLTWILNRLKGAGRAIEDLLAGVWDVFKALWNTLYAFGLNQIREWVRMAQTAIASVPRVISFLLNVYQTLRWAFLYLIPHWAIAEAGKAITWAGRELSKLGHWALVRTIEIVDFFTRLYHDIRNALSVAVRTISRWIDELRVGLSIVARIVFDLLRNPEHLAIFVFGALWRLFWRTAERLAEPIARWLFRKLLPVVIHELPLIERVLSDIF